MSGSDLTYGLGKMFGLGAGCLIVAAAGVVCVSLLVVGGCVARWGSDAEQVVREELGPKALLKKYEHFKNLAAALDAKRADIEVYETRTKSLEDRYKGVEAKDWPRHEVERVSVWEQEVAGLKSAYNALAKDYNASMAKENYRFCNVGDLPRGAEKPLPREYAPYITK